MVAHTNSNQAQAAESVLHWKGQSIFSMSKRFSCAPLATTTKRKKMLWRRVCDIVTTLTGRRRRRRRCRLQECCAKTNTALSALLLSQRRATADVADVRNGVINAEVSGKRDKIGSFNRGSGKTGASFMQL